MFHLCHKARVHACQETGASLNFDRERTNSLTAKSYTTAAVYRKDWTEKKIFAGKWWKGFCERVRCRWEKKHTINMKAQSKLFTGYCNFSGSFLALLNFLKVNSKQLVYLTLPYFSPDNWHPALKCIFWIAGNDSHIHFKHANTTQNLADYVVMEHNSI